MEIRAFYGHGSPSLWAWRTRVDHGVDQSAVKHSERWRENGQIC